MADTAAPPPPAPPAAGLPAAPGSNPLSRKLNKILETRLDNDKEMLEALKALSTFFVENSLRTRRNLRGDIERRSLAINEEFVHIFKQVKEELESINEDVQAMSSCCEDMSSRLKAAKEQTQDLIVKTTKLQAENQRLEMKAQVADAFIAKFQLTSDEMNLLRGTKDEPITEDFFKALGRVKQIHDDVKILLRTNQQRAGLEIMEQMALLQETSYERLYRWTQNECRSLTQESCDISPVLAQAMEALQDRPVLYKYTLDEFGTARRSAVVRGFIDALTRGGLGGTPRPIEMHSHDPLRYVGDMLAWLHQATASEKEHLEAMLKLVTIQGVEENIQEVVGHITEGVCRPLKVKYFVFLSILNIKTVLSCFSRTAVPISTMYFHCPWLRIRFSTLRIIKPFKIKDSIPAPFVLLLFNNSSFCIERDHEKFCLFSSYSLSLGDPFDRNH
uniref:Conserved oligomeric Golgi complex subunit 6 n=1 Tax=Accipiter nisus TaxID=211598 RepID=A0A8B9NLY7_9AVES